VAADAAGPWITIVGSTMIDLVAFAERVPERGETIVGERFLQGFGGKGANQAVMARLMGARVAMVNAVGEDGYGEQTLANFARYGIDTAHVRRVPGASGVAPIWVEADGSNRIIIIPGANLLLQPEHGTDGVLAQERVDAVIGQFEIEQAVTAAGFRAGRERGAITILNPAPGAPILSELAAVSDWIIPNENEFAIIAGGAGLSPDASDHEALAALAQHLGTRILVTLGERGAALVARDGTVRAIAAPRVDVVDTTGAGDAFVGAFAYGLASGWDEVAAARLGCAIAADSVQRPGTQSSFPDEVRSRAIVAEVAAG
jgi:ribokinase